MLTIFYTLKMLAEMDIIRSALDAWGSLWNMKGH